MMDSRHLLARLGLVVMLGALFLTVLSVPVFAIAPGDALKLVRAEADPVIDFDHPDCRDNKYGFEGGLAVKVDGTYHLFVAEMYGDAFWIAMRLAHWTSPDALHWKRASTLLQSDGVPSATNARMCFWSPFPLYDEAEGRWTLFYVSYRGPRPDEKGGHNDGKIWRAVSAVPGRGGIGGPYKDDRVILEKDAASEPWEGQQGVDSFFPYRVGDRWVALYGGHNYTPISPWRVGLATAPSMQGPWTRLPELNPSPIEPMFIENPIVYHFDDGPYLAIYDNCPERPPEVPDVGAYYGKEAYHIGYAFSADGLHWMRGRSAPVIPPGSTTWSMDARTPLCLIPEENGEFTMLYTAQRSDRKFWSVGLARMRFENPTGSVRKTRGGRLPSAGQDGQN